MVATGHIAAADTASMVRCNHEATRLRAATADDATPEMLEALAGDRDPTVRLAVAAHPNTDAGTLARMAVVDTDARVRDTLWRRVTSGNPSADLLGLLAQFSDRAEAVKLLRHEHLPAEGVRSIYRRHTDDFTGTGLNALSRTVLTHRACPADVLDEVASAPSAPTGVHRICAAHPNLPPRRLTGYVTHRTAAVRAAAAENPSASVANLEQLVMDDVEAVWKAAFSNPNADEGVRAYGAIRRL